MNQLDHQMHCRIVNDVVFYDATPIVTFITKDADICSFSHFVTEDMRRYHKKSFSSCMLSLLEKAIEDLEGFKFSEDVTQFATELHLNRDANTNPTLPAKLYSYSLVDHKNKAMYHLTRDEYNLYLRNKKGQANG